MHKHPPNILLFIPHDLGDTLHGYGHPDVRSPHLDELARRGTLFASYYCASPECSPSRGAMMTGCHPHNNGMAGLANFGWELRRPHLAALLSDLGYASHLFGTQHETHLDPCTLGYGQHHPCTPPPGCIDNAATVCHEVGRFLQDTSPAAAPWFICAGFRDVHRPWQVETSFRPDQVILPPQLPDTPAVREDFTRFYQAIENMDTAIGDTLDILRASSHAENTLVIFTTDHGAPFPHAKATLYEGGLRIPLIMHWPGHIQGGTCHTDLLSNVDFTPTLLDLLGAYPASQAFDGESFAPLLRGEQWTPRDQIVSSLLYDVSYDPIHAIRTASHKYIRSFAVTPEDAEGADPEVLATHVAGRWIRVDDYDVMSGQTWQTMALPQPKPPREELYDLAADPAEMHDLATDPAYATILHELRQRLDRWLHLTQSPLLQGHIPPPDKQRDAARRYRPTPAPSTE